MRDSKSFIYKFNNQDVIFSSELALFEYLKFIALSKQLVANADKAALDEVLRELRNPSLSRASALDYEHKMFDRDGKETKKKDDAVHVENFDEVAIGHSGIAKEFHDIYIQNRHAAPTNKELLMCNIVLMMYTQNPSLLANSLNDFKSGMIFNSNLNDSFWGISANQKERVFSKNALGKAHEVVLRFIQKELHDKGSVAISTHIYSSIYNILHIVPTDQRMNPIEYSNETEKLIQRDLAVSNSIFNSSTAIGICIVGGIAATLIGAHFLMKYLEVDRPMTR